MDPNVIPDESAYRGRDPWFDRLTVLSKAEGLTTLSEVEGVSSKLLFFLDSGQSLRAFRNDGSDDRTQNIEFFSRLLVKTVFPELTLCTNRIP